MLPDTVREARLWELRARWVDRQTVRLSLSDRCVVSKVIGRVQRVATTGAFAVVDGWHVPIDDILAIGNPLIEEIEDYEREVRGVVEQMQAEAMW